VSGDEHGHANEARRVQVWQVLPVDSCHVSLELNSQWRNGEHWHAVWPEDEGHWCYETQAEAAERVAECQQIRAEAALRAAVFEVTP